MSVCEHDWIPRPEHGQGRYECRICKRAGRRDLVTGVINQGRDKARPKRSVRGDLGSAGYEPDDWSDTDMNGRKDPD